MLEQSEILTPTGSAGVGMGLEAAGLEAIRNCLLRWLLCLSGVLWCPQCVHSEDGIDWGSGWRASSSPLSKVEPTIVPVAEMRASESCTPDHLYDRDRGLVQ